MKLIIGGIYNFKRFPGDNYLVVCIDNKYNNTSLYFPDKKIENINSNSQFIEELQKLDKFDISPFDYLHLKPEELETVINGFLGCVPDEILKKIALK